jgi:hypothetical protein
MDTPMVDDAGRDLSQSGTRDFDLEVALLPAVVHMATGMVSAQLGVDVHDALARLRTAARCRDLDLVDLACQVVNREYRFRPDGQHGVDGPAGHHGPNGHGRGDGHDGGDGSGPGGG